MLDVTMTHVRYWRYTSLLIILTEHSHTESHPMTLLILTVLWNTDKSDPIIVMSVVVNTSGLVYDDFVRLIFLYVYHESSDLAGELPEESDHFRFLLTTSLTNLKESVGLSLHKPRQVGLLFPSTCLHGLSYLSLVSFTLVERPSSYSFPILISSTLCLSDTSSASLCIIVLVWHFSPLTLVFFILM